MGLLYEEPEPGSGAPDVTVRLLLIERRLGDISESLSEIATGLHMMGANQARAMKGEPPAYAAEDFGFDLLIPNEVNEEENGNSVAEQ